MPSRVGRIVGTHGLKGEVKVELLTDFVERLDTGSRLRLQGNWVTVEQARAQKDRLILKLSGVDDIDAAQALQWQYLESKSDAKPKLEEDEYVTADLIGLRVETEAGEELGKVEEVLPMPAHDVLVVGGIMIPAVKEFVRLVDVEGGRIQVRLIEGMRE